MGPRREKRSAAPGALYGGQRRRRSTGARLALLLMLLAPLVVVVAGYESLVRDDGRGGSRPPLEVIGATGPVAPEPGGSLEPRSLAPIRLTGVDAFRLSFRRPPAAALVFDLDSGDVLYRHRPLRVAPMASLTKIMTALVVTEETRPADPVRITRDALEYSGSGVGVLPEGKRVRLETLLNGLMIVSGNDAAIALAVHVSDTERRFVALMNEKARLWGLRCTSFVSSHGLEDGNRSCPADLAVMARLAMRKERIARIARRPQASFRFPVKGGRLFLAGHNPLIRARYPGALGLKTGYTSAAGRCFVGVARRAGRTLGVVLLDSPNPDTQAPKLLDLGFRYG